jgi:spermidine synthase
MRSEMNFWVPYCVHKNPLDVTQDISMLNNERKFDIIIADITAQVMINNLKNDGIGIVNTTIKDLKETLKSFEDFSIVMPYLYFEDEKLLCSIFVSNKYHPTADLISQKSDFVENVEYYSTEIHRASFVLPSKMERELRGYTKN